MADQSYQSILTSLSRKERQRITFILVFILVYFIVLYNFARKNPSSTSNLSSTSTLVTNLNNKTIERILILYVWGNTDQQSLGNLQFFIRYGVDASQPADYYFILQRMDKKPINESTLPTLPSNAHYIQHDNECYDIGTFGWFFKQNIVNTNLYKYIILMNSSVRGPFLVAPLSKRTTWWFDYFTERLTDQIKLVGSTISCAEKPHIQSYIMATDQIGLSLLRSDASGVFKCHNGYGNAIVNGEIAASQYILRSNYQIASLQLKYQGWDFRKKENQKCNGALSPIYYDGAVDGISHDPFELIFIKFKGAPPFDTDLERRAAIYQQWLEGQPSNQGKKRN